MSAFPSYLRAENRIHDGVHEAATGIVGARGAGSELFSSVTFPGESGAYRAARDRLLAREAELRRALEAVAAERRAMPAGGLVPEDYVFEGISPHGAPTRVRMSELFISDKPTLVIYSFMFGAQRPRPCPACTALLDPLDAAARNITQLVDLAVVASSPVLRLRAFAEERGWRELNLLSCADNSYNRDYHGVSRSQGVEMPMLNVFRRERGVIRHWWGSELLYAATESHEDFRHLDQLMPLWGLLDLTPMGRGEFRPQLTYG